MKDSYLIDAAIWSLSNLHFEGMNRTGHQNFCSLPINVLEQIVKVLDLWSKVYTQNDYSNSTTSSILSLLLYKDGPNIYINANDVTSRNFSFSIILFFIKTKCIIRSFIFFFHQNKMYHLIIHIFCCIKDAQLFMLLYVNLKSLFSKT